MLQLSNLFESQLILTLSGCRECTSFMTKNTSDHSDYPGLYPRFMVAFLSRISLSENWYSFEWIFGVFGKMALDNIFAFIANRSP